MYVAIEIHVYAEVKECFRVYVTMIVKILVHGLARHAQCSVRTIKTDFCGFYIVHIIIYVQYPIELSRNQ